MVIVNSAHFVSRAMPRLEWLNDVSVRQRQNSLDVVVIRELQDFFHLIGVSFHAPLSWNYSAQYLMICLEYVCEVNNACERKISGDGIVLVHQEKVELWKTPKLLDSVGAEWSSSMRVIKIVNLLNVNCASELCAERHFQYPAGCKYQSQGLKIRVIQHQLARV